MRRNKVAKEKKVTDLYAEANKKKVTNLFKKKQIYC
jgi:hypothetical protein